MKPTEAKTGSVAESGEQHVTPLMNQTRNPPAFVIKGLAFDQVRERRLDKAEFTSFAAYCRAKCHVSSAYVWRLIGAAKFFTRVFADWEGRIPDREGLVRPLLCLRPKAARAAWARAVEIAGDQRITAALVNRAVRELGSGPAATAAPKAPLGRSNSDKRQALEHQIGELLALAARRGNHQVLVKKLGGLYSLVDLLLADDRC